MWFHLLFCGGHAECESEMCTIFLMCYGREVWGTDLDFASFFLISQAATPQCGRFGGQGGGRGRIGPLCPSPIVYQARCVQIPDLGLHGRLGHNGPVKLHSKTGSQWAWNT